MNYLVRDIDDVLLAWKKEIDRKPLLLRGARQVGKSSVVRNFGKSFDFVIEVNFEQRKDICVVFEGSLDPIQICEQLALLYNTPIIAGKTLLFFDEIQSCPNAISSLRFFYEQFPALHLVAAGSLLEFALTTLPSFGVGRIRSLFLYPFSFGEFLKAANEKMLFDAVGKASPEKPLPESVHLKLLQLYRRFLIIGGMPKVVSTYVETKDLLGCQQIIDDLILSYNDDFQKYSHRISVFMLREVFRSVVRQSGTKYVYAKTSPEINRLHVKDCLHLLEMAGLIYPVTHSAANGIPLGAELNEKFRKFIVFDTGIFQRIQGLDLPSMLLNNDIQTVNRGVLTELAVGLELKKNSSFTAKADLYYWTRDKKNSQAEVDYVVQIGTEIVPVEVKSGTKGSMQSLFLFLDEKKKDKGIRFSQENFSSYDRVDVYPLYAVKNLFINR